MILVDELRRYEKAPITSTRWCHMVTDADTFDELHHFAAQLGLRREWFQGDHYDITSRRRGEALRLGAVSVTSRELVVRRLRKDGTHGIPGLAVPA